MTVWWREQNRTRLTRLVLLPPVASDGGNAPGRDVPRGIRGSRAPRRIHLPSARTPSTASDHSGGREGPCSPKPAREIARQLKPRPKSAPCIRLDAGRPSL